MVTAEDTSLAVVLVVPLQPSHCQVSLGDAINYLAFRISLHPLFPFQLICVLLSTPADSVQIKQVLPRIFMEEMQGVGAGAQHSFNQRHQEAFLSSRGVLSTRIFRPFLTTVNIAKLPQFAPSFEETNQQAIGLLAA